MVLLLQFSTSHYCRKARLALGYKGIPYEIENLVPGLHVLKVKPLTGTTTLPVLMPQHPEQPEAIGDSTCILDWLDHTHPTPGLLDLAPDLQPQAHLLEDWLDESIGVAARFVYYDYRAGEGKAIDPSLMSQVVIRVVRRQYGMNAARVALATKRLAIALVWLEANWSSGYLVGDRLTRADLTAAALLSPLALLPHYRQQYPWLFDRIATVHQHCGEPLPPGLS